MNFEFLARAKAIAAIYDALSLYANWRVQTTGMTCRGTSPPIGSPAGVKVDETCPCFEHCAERTIAMLEKIVTGPVVGDYSKISTGEKR